MTEIPLALVARSFGAAFMAGDPASAAKEPERANVDHLARLVHAISSGRFDEFRALLADDVEYELLGPPGSPWPFRVRGADAVTAAIEENFASVAEQMPEVLAMSAQGDTVMLMARERGRWRATGAPYEHLLAQQFTFRDGQLSVFRSVVGEVPRDS